MEYRKINLYHILQFLKDKMKEIKNLDYTKLSVKVGQSNYSHYSSIRSWCVENWDFKKELLHQQNTEIVTLFSAEDISELIKFQAE